jgi:two-component system chemotaxis response regulator CheB
VTITVLIVEDSPVVAEFLSAVLGSDPAIHVVGVVSDGEAAVEAARRLRPSVITMDIHMPRVDGFDATRRIMETCPTPIVIVSGSVPAGAGHDDVRAVAAGAVATVARPSGIGHPDHAESARRLVEMVKLMSEVKVIRRWPRVGAPCSTRDRASRASSPSAPRPAGRRCCSPSCPACRRACRCRC